MRSAPSTGRPFTIKSYSTAVRQLAAFALAKDRGDVVTTYDKRLIRDFLAHIIETRSPATAQTPRRHLELLSVARR